MVKIAYKHVRLYTDGHSWFLQDLSSGNLVGRYKCKDTALKAVALNAYTLVH